MPVSQRRISTVVEKLKARKYELFDYGENTHNGPEMNDQFAKLRRTVEKDLKSLKATPISSLAAYESNQSLLVRSIQSDELRYTAKSSVFRLK